MKQFIENIKKLYVKESKLSLKAIGITLAVIILIASVPAVYILSVKDKNDYPSENDSLPGVSAIDNTSDKDETSSEINMDNSYASAISETENISDTNSTENSVPAESITEESKPEVSVPTESQPEVSVPDVSKPEVSTPEESKDDDTSQTPVVTYKDPLEEYIAFVKSNYSSSSTDVKTAVEKVENLKNQNKINTTEGANAITDLYAKVDKVTERSDRTELRKTIDEIRIHVYPSVLMSEKLVSAYNTAVDLLFSPQATQTQINKVIADLKTEDKNKIDIGNLQGQYQNSLNYLLLSDLPELTQLKVAQATAKNILDLKVAATQSSVDSAALGISNIIKAINEKYYLTSTTRQQMFTYYISYSKYISSDYNQTTWNQFKNCLDVIKGYLCSETVNESDESTAIENLRTAYNELVIIETVDITPLSTRIAEIQAMGFLQEKYTLQSTGRVTSIITESLLLLDQNTKALTNKTVQNKLAELNEAYNNLVKLPDKKAFFELLLQCWSLDYRMYTTQSFRNVTDAINNALLIDEAVGEPTQAQVNAAIKQMTDAKNGLVKIKDIPNTSMKTGEDVLQSAGAYTIKLGNLSIHSIIDCHRNQRDSKTSIKFESQKFGSTFIFGKFIADGKSKNEYFSIESYYAINGGNNTAITLAAIDGNNPTAYAKDYSVCGIKLGDSLDQVKQLYPKAQYGDGYMTYSSKNSKGNYFLTLTVSFTAEKKVSKIYFEFSPIGGMFRVNDRDTTIIIM
ncbi:MAG: hypothetical protein A2Y17_01955 [Clostridiales bacterium GWF2_38_85]|nr:MAG: hypothetical protein A2Y17_01955 [Clostridiales bacterium GWF2_38_85]HBL85337.1 hypothetical protein [Clostridiales bacterium]